MLRERAVTYFLDKGHNCAESVLLAANDEYALGLSDDAMKMLSPFGGGCGCGRLCGAQAGALAVIGRLGVKGSAHETPGFGKLCATFVAEFEEMFGSGLCAEIKPRFAEPGRRCAAVVEQTADALDRFLRDNGLL